MSCPADVAYGPSWPQPVIRPYTRAGFRARQSSGPMPSRSATPGRNPSNTTSAPSTRRSTTSRPASDLRSTPMLRRPRPLTKAGGRSGSPPRTETARSIRTTSAPMSASIIPQNGPGPIPASSITRTPSSAPTVMSPRSVLWSWLGGAVGPVAVGRDGVDQVRPGSGGQVVAPAVDQHKVGPGDDSCCPLTT